MDELISRQAALGEIKKCRFVVDAIEKISALPSAQPEQKTGRWEWDEEGGAFLCSICNSGYRDQPTLMGKPLFVYCPMCGAEMKGANDG